METMTSLMVTMLTCLGLGFLAPWPRAALVGPWAGLRMVLGFCLLISSLFLLHLVFRLPLQVAAWVTAGGAAVGWVLGLRRAGGPVSLVHPVVLLPLAVFVDIAFRGLDYMPLAWDELSNWLAWTRQSVLTGRLLGADIIHGVQGYTPGWPLALAYPSLLAGHFEFNHAALVPFVMHVAVLGLLFDVIAAALLRRGTGQGPALIGAWAILLALLAVEATWKSVPTHLLVEEPQSYLLLAWLAVAWLILDGQVGRHEGAFCLGVIFLGGYLIKVAMLAFAPAALLLLLWAGWPRRPGQTFRPLAGMLLLAAAPTVAAYGVWRVTGWQPSCLSDPLAVLRAFLAGGETLGRAEDLFLRLFGWILGYLGTYKLPLTALGAAAFCGLASLPQARPLAAAFLLYAVLYFGSLYLYHLDCFGEYYFQALNSPDRFTRVPLRLLHVAAIVVPGIPLVALALRNGMSQRLVLVLVAVLAAWQGWRSDGAVRAMTTRWDASADQVSVVSRMRRAAGAVGGLVADRPELGRQVFVIAQGDDGYQRLIITFYAEGRFAVADGYSWGEVPANAWMAKADAEAVLALLAKASLIWPAQLDDWMVQVLRLRLEDPRCAERLEDHYLLPAPEGRFSCHPKP